MIWDLEKWGERTALIQDDRYISYRELADESERLAAAAGERALAFVIASNVYELVVGYISFLNHGIVPLMLHKEIDPALLSDLMELYRPSLIWCPETFGENLGGSRLTQIGSYVLLQTDCRDHPVLHEDLALLISTSGSTGSPKLIRQSCRNIISNTESIIEYLHIDENETAITSLPMNYVYALSILNTHLYAGAKLVLTEAGSYSKPFWQLVDQYQVTSFSGVPFMYEMLDKLRFTKKDRHPSLVTMTQAGGKLMPALHEKFAQFADEYGKKFVVMYGASEATARMGYLPPEKAVQKKGSMGIAIPGGRFELLDEENHVVTDPDVAGELVYYGDNVTLGYAQCAADLAKGDENGGCLKTGDIARRDEDGYYYIVGRMKRFVKMVGKRVNLDEVERMLKTDFHNVDIACTGKDDLLVVCSVENLDEEKIRDYLLSRFQINRRMVEVRYLDEIPKNPSGKTEYAKLKEAAGL